MSSVAALLLILATSAFAQETTGNIEGTVKDPQGNVVTGATVTITSVGTTAGARQDATTGFTRTATTNQEGFFRVLQIPPGFYKVEVGAISGFGAAEVTGVEVVLGKTTPLNVSLGASGVSETVTVSADQVAIDPTDNKIQTNITAQVAELLPKGTNFTSLLTVAPAVRAEPLSGGFQIDGASGSENTFIIDGQEVSNFRTGTLNTNNNVPFQFVQEVQIKSSGFEAEFGGATGGVINVVTKGGSNDWHGEFGMQFRPSNLQPGPRPFLSNVFTSGAALVNPRRDEGTDFFPTATFSGPIIRDRAWFLVSHTPQILNSTRVITYRNPNTGVVAGNESYRASTHRWYDFARVDANITNTLRFTGSYVYNPIVNDGLLEANANALSTSIPSVTFPGGRVLSGAALLGQQGGRVNSQNTTGMITWTPTGNLVVTARGGYSFLNEKGTSYGLPDVVGQARIFCSTAGDATKIPAEAGCVTGQQSSPAFTATIFDASRRRTFDADASYLVGNFGGRHQFKGGYQLNALANDILSKTSDQVSIRYGRTITETSGLSFLTPSANAIGSGFIRQLATQGNAASRNHALYFQDGWQPTSRLTLNLGFRVERENVPSFLPGRPSINFDFFDKFAPRLGAAFDLTGDGRTKIFASYGWFYDRFKYELPRGSFGGDFFHDLYFEIFPGDGRYDTLTPSRLMAGYVPVAGGNCPISPPVGRIRCDLDFRIASNSGTGEGGEIDPDIRPFRQSEFTVGLERDLGGGYLFSGRYTHKQVDETVEDIGFSSASGSEAYIIGNPGRGLAAEVAQDFGFLPLGAERKYDAVEVRLDKRFTRRYYFNVNYTWSRLFGNYSGLSSSDEAGRNSPNVNRFFDLPIVGFTALGQPDNGRLPTDRPHVFKFYGAYTLDWNDQFGRGGGNNTEFSLFTTLQSGTPLTTRFNIFNIDNTILNGRGDLGRTEAFSQTDIAVHHKYRFGTNERFTMAFDVDLLNVFNQANVLGVFENISSTNIPASSIGLSSNTPTAEAQFQRQNTRDAIMTYLNAVATRKDTRYGIANRFQDPRSVRFGFRLLF